MFGFIDGADIGNEGEKAFEYEATGSFQKRGGRYIRASSMSSSSSTCRRRISLTS